MCVELYDLRGGVVAPVRLVSIEGIFLVGHLVSLRFNTSMRKGFMLYDSIATPGDSLIFPKLLPHRIVIV